MLFRSQEVLNNLESIHGALLRMNRSIQAEGIFGVMKYDRWHKRLVRRGQIKVELDIYLEIGRASCRERV